MFRQLCIITCTRHYAQLFTFLKLNMIMSWQIIHDLPNHNYYLLVYQTIPHQMLIRVNPPLYGKMYIYVAMYIKPFNSLLSLNSHTHARMHAHTHTLYA